MFRNIRLPNKEPLIKLVPTIKPIGKSTESSKNKLTLLLFELFCTAKNKTKNKHVLNDAAKINFLVTKYIFLTLP